MIDILKVFILDFELIGHYVLGNIAMRTVGGILTNVLSVGPVT
jgi:hypothetical protein